MIVFLLSVKLVQLEAFKKEIMDFPVETREDIFSLVVRFTDGEVMNRKDLKIFKLD